MAISGFTQSVSDTIDANFTLDIVSGHLYRNLFFPPIASLVYVVLIFSGKRWMTDKQACDLRLPLTVWNFVLAAFSIVGFVVTAPPIFELVGSRGYMGAVCTSYIEERALLAFWCLLFVYSKIFEFGDTLFVVLRKTPLNFLHWYHHITVLLYSWHGLATRNTLGPWFSTMNFGVHSFMYSYYMFKAMGFKISGSVAKAITVMQLSQMAAGLFLLLSAVWAKWIGEWAKQNGRSCGVNNIHIVTGLLMYGSYFVLFMNFFYRRYITGSPKSAKKKD
jgi:elongation of very long chain fatty acids protein 6